MLVFMRPGVEDVAGVKEDSLHFVSIIVWSCLRVLVKVLLDQRDQIQHVFNFCVRLRAFVGFTIIIDMVDLDSRPETGSLRAQDIAIDFVPDVDTGAGWHLRQACRVVKNCWIRFAPSVFGREDHRVKVGVNPVLFKAVRDLLAALRVADATYL